MSKLFVLGVGAPKTGTTWLHSYLSSSDRCRMGCLKEYHVWDAKFIECCSEMRLGLKNIKPAKSFFVRYMMQNIPGFYEYYFNSITSNRFITGDITPAYCGLSRDKLSLVKTKMERADFKVKVIFLMRDPVERCWSAARMRARNLVRNGEVVDATRVRAIFENSFRSEHFVFRTRYDVAIKNIDAVFPDNDVYYGIYENMFDRNNIRRLSEFVGIEAKYDHAGVVKNASPSDAKIDNRLIDECKRFYAKTYEFCHHRFPETKLLWRS